MPSTYTQNLGIEQPATGEQANTWGITVNRNMDTVDMAINGNVHIPLSTSPYQLIINNGQTKPLAANPMITWTGAQSAQGVVRIDYQNSRQHIYCMSNQTTGGYGIAFAQGTGTQFVLQAGYDALLYSDGAGAAANVAAALANPQFNNLLLTGAAQVNGTLTLEGSLQMGVVTITADAQGNVHLSGGLGVASPTAIPDPVTINGLGSVGQLRMVGGGYGVILRNDGATFYLMVTAANDPYGAYSGSYPLGVDLPSRNVGMAGWAPSASYGLSVPTLHVSTVTVDSTITASGAVSGASIHATNGRSYFASGDQYQIGLQNGSYVNYLGSNASGQIQFSNANGTSVVAIDSAGNAAFAGGVHSLAGGFQFPDGSIQTTAVSNSFPGNLTVNGVISGPASALNCAVLYCYPWAGTNPTAPPHSIMFTHNEGQNYMTIWVIKADGTKWLVNQNLVQAAGG